MKTKVSIRAGICGFETTVYAWPSQDGERCHLEIESQCPTFKKVGNFLTDLDPIAETGWQTSAVHQMVREHCQHTSCPVPAGILKAVQVATGNALPANAFITFKELTED